MAHIVYVDLSAKVEQWTRASAVAMSNDGRRVYLVSGKVKQHARRLIKQRHGGKSAQYRLLAALVFLVVREDLPHISQIVIDQDYAGTQAEATIKNLLLHLLRKEMPNVTAGFVRFAEVRGSQADRLAKQVYDGEQTPDRVLCWQELEALL
jgi:hypothetical protein